MVQTTPDYHPVVVIGGDKTVRTVLLLSTALEKPEKAIVKSS